MGSLTGTSTVTSYIESAAGVAAGARTGLGNLVIAGFFFAAMFCAPLVAAIPSYATAPALIIVGALMCGAVAKVRWDDFTDAFPAFLTLVATPLTFSIATGLSLGMISFTFIKVATGKLPRNQPADLGSTSCSCFAIFSWLVNNPAPGPLFDRIFS